MGSEPGPRCRPACRLCVRTVAPNLDEEHRVRRVSRCHPFHANFLESFPGRMVADRRGERGAGRDEHIGGDPPRRAGRRFGRSPGAARRGTAWTTTPSIWPAPVTTRSSMKWVGDDDAESPAEADTHRGTITLAGLREALRLRADWHGVRAERRHRRRRGGGDGGVSVGATRGSTPSQAAPTKHRREPRAGRRGGRRSGSREVRRRHHAGQRAVRPGSRQQRPRRRHPGEPVGQRGHADDQHGLATDRLAAHRGGRDRGRGAHRRGELPPSDAGPGHLRQLGRPGRRQLPGRPRVCPHR